MAETVQLTRLVGFSAAHHYWVDAWPPERNTAEFGPSTGIHGHNYKLWVTVEGPIQADDMTLNLTELKELLDAHVRAPFDFTHLNQLPEFQGKQPTLEVMITLLWARLHPIFEKRSLRLVSLKLAENDDLWVTYYGQRANVTPLHRDIVA